MALTDRLLDAPIAQVRQAVTDGAASVTGLVRAALDRVDRATAALACFRYLDTSGALALAAQMDQAPPPHPAPPLWGVPMAHKDLFAHEGRPAGFGADPRYLRAPGPTAPLLEALARCGSVDLGALHLSEFAMGPAGWSETYGFIDNPLAPSRVSGGSSSGSAAAVAHRVVHAALGSDTGGSIRLPAAFCGIVGLKPTHGRWPLEGVQPVSPSQDTVGPMARTVDDCQQVFDAIDAQVARDQARHDRQTAAPGAPLKLAFIAEEDLPVPPDREVAAAFSHMLERLRAAGHSVERVRVDLSTVGLLSGIVFLSEAAAEHLPRLQEPDCAIGPQVRDRLVQGLAYPAAQYLRALAARTGHRATWATRYFSRFDAVLSPTAPCLAPLRSTYAQLGDSGSILKFNSRLGAYTGYVNYLGFPALTVPLVRSREDGGIGMQVIGKDDSEATLFAVGREIERLAASADPGDPSILQENQEQ